MNYKAAIGAVAIVAMVGVCKVDIAPEIVREPLKPFAAHAYVSCAYSTEVARIEEVEVEDTTEIEDAVEEVPAIEVNEEPIVESPIFEEVPPSAPIEYEEPIIEPVYELVEEPTEGEWIYYGTCFITHYCNCELCCGKWAGGNTASGTYPTAGRTVAMMSMPFGTQVLIDGCVYTVEDRGYWDEMWVDIYVDSHEEAYARGAYYTEVYIR